MEGKNIRRIAVIGAGTMGHGIAAVAALAGYVVVLRDINQELVKKGLDSIKDSLNKMVRKEKISEEEAKEAIGRISPRVALKGAVKDAGFIIEAIPEKMELKKELFKDLDELSPSFSILASNTSSLSITEIASSTSRPDKVIGMHFFNPVIKMKLVEVIRGEKTSEETTQKTKKLAESLGKTPVVCKKDVPGFIVNSILIPYLIEAGRMVNRGEASIQQIDSAMKHKEKLPMGPFELADLVGLDVVAHIGEAIGEEVPFIIRDKLEGDELGRKSGKGFYNYNDGGVDYSKADGKKFDTLGLLSIMANEAAKLIQQGASTVEDVEKAMKLGTGMSQGPITKAKEAGLEQVVKKLEELWERYRKERYKPSRWLEKKAQLGG